MTPLPVSVLVLARAPRVDSTDARLASVLGAERCARLEAVLIRRAVAWGLGTAPDSTFVACEPGVDVDAVRAAVPPTVEVLSPAGDDAGQRAIAASERVFAASGRPQLVVGTTLPWLGDYHAEAAVEDLADGCDVSLGVAIGGGLYLLAMARPQPRLLALAAQGHDGEVTRRVSREIAEELGLGIGMLHYERALDAPLDIVAMAGDPLLPPDVAAALVA